jgi:hypothetical protein
VETVARAPDKDAGGERPLVSMEGWARFEQRARQRRLERRLEAARGAMRSHDFAAAHDALKELKELDPAHPEILALASQLARTQAAPSPRHAGALAAAAAAFATVLLAASWVGNTGLLQSYPIVETAALAPVREALLAARDISFDDSVAKSGELKTLPPAATAEDPPDIPVLTPPKMSAAVAPIVTPPPPTAAVIPPPPNQPQLDLPASSGVEPAVPLPPPASPRPPASSAPIAATATPARGAALDVAPAVVDDSALVRAVLQKYQAAYERLDAGLVHAVWPGVNEAALARAFGGLESQALDFKTCYIQLRGATADVLCTGSTRYVPKVGSREPRVEPLAWNFTLRKRASDWEIETARAER